MAAVDATAVVKRVGTSGWRGATSFRGLRGSDQLALSAFAFVTFVALIGPMLAPHDPSLAAGSPFAAPSWQHPFGTDPVGRDIFSRVLSGIQTTWLSAFLVIASGVVIGGMIGLVAGATGGTVDSVLMRFTDICLALPGSILAIAVVAALGPSLTNTLLAVALLWWPFYARLVRADIRALAARPHYEAARLAGTSRARRLVRHLLPGAFPVLVVAASLDIANLILLLAGLSFIGLGAPAPAPELGAMTSAGLPHLLTSWWIPIIPATAVFLLSLIGNLAGDAVRDIVAK